MSNDDAALAFDSISDSDARTQAYCELPELETLRSLMPECDDYAEPMLPLVPEAKRPAVPEVGRRAGTIYRAGFIVEGE